MRIKLFYWPIITFVWFTVAFILTYFVSVLTKTVYPFFPYISISGAYPPASCIFGLLLNIGSLMVGIIVYVRFRQVNFGIRTGECKISHRTNKAALWCGIIIVFGISLVGNFQAKTEGPTSVLVVHFLGALLAFGIGGIYLTIQCIISFALRPVYKNFPNYQAGKPILYFRIVLTVMHYAFFLATLISSEVGKKYYSGDITWWTEDDDGHSIHLVSAFSEWFMAITLIIYLLSMTKEFKSMEFKEISIKTKCIEGNQII